MAFYNPEPPKQHKKWTEILQTPIIPVPPSNASDYRLSTFTPVTPDRISTPSDFQVLIYLTLNTWLFSPVPFKTSDQYSPFQAFMCLATTILMVCSPSGSFRSSVVSISRPESKTKARYMRGNDTTVVVLTQGVNTSDGNSFLHLELYISGGRCYQAGRD